VTTGSATTQTATLLTTGSLVVTAEGSGAYYVVSAGATITASTGTNDVISADQKKFTSGHASDNTFTVVPTGAAGSTFTITGYTTNASGVVTAVLTVSIAATSEYGVASASKSTVSWVTEDGDAATADVANQNTTPYNTGLFLNVQLKDAYGNEITSGTGALVATVTTGATVAIGAVSGSGTSSTGDAVTNAGTYTQAVSNANPSDINLLVKEATAGAGWNGTVTVTYNGVVIATKSGKITGAPASMLVAPAKIGPKEGSEVTWVYYVKDSAGNELTSVTADISMASSSDKSVVSAAAAATATAPGTSTAYGYGTTTCVNG